MADKRWKAVERAIADLFGLQREPVPGRQRGDKPDIGPRDDGEGPDWLVGEVKAHQSLPAWMIDAMDQAEKSATGTQTPMVVLHRKHHPYKESYVVLKAKDFAGIVYKAEAFRREAEAIRSTNEERD